MLDEDAPNGPVGPKAAALAGLAGAIAAVLAGALAVGVGAAAGVDIGYGYGLFLILPIVNGFVATWVLQKKGQRTLWQCFAASQYGVLASALALLAFSLEGAVCIVMATPIVVLGVLVGVALARALGTRDGGGAVRLSLLPLAVSAMVAEHWMVSPETSHTVNTEFVIAASPEQIWPSLLTTGGYPDPTEPLLQVGVAHPIGTATEPKVGGDRTCRLSTGPMRERVEVFEPGKKLQWRVLSTPDTMREWNPFGTPRPPHLRGYFECLWGGIELIPLEGGRTRLVGTTSYTQRLGPSWYWSLWTNHIVRDVQQRVFRQIGSQMESRLSARH